MNHKRNSLLSGSYVALTRAFEPGNACASPILSAPLGNGCVEASILPREAAGTLALHPAQSRIPLALANRYPEGSPLWHLFNNFYRHTLNRVECARVQPVEIQHE